MSILKTIERQENRDWFSELLINMFLNVNVWRPYNIKVSTNALLGYTDNYFAHGLRSDAPSLKSN